MGHGGNALQGCNLLYYGGPAGTTLQPMTPEAALQAVEQQLAKMSAALVAADALAAEQSSAQLRRDLEALIQASRSLQGQPWPEALRPRMQAVSNQLAMQREQLARLGALVDRQAASILPPAEPAPTYGQAGSAARIYRSTT